MHGRTPAYPLSGVSASASAEPGTIKQNNVKSSPSSSAIILPNVNRQPGTSVVAVNAQKAQSSVPIKKAAAKNDTAEHTEHSYFGQIKDGLFHGKGMLKYTNSEVYEVREEKAHEKHQIMLV